MSGRRASAACLAVVAMAIGAAGCGSGVGRPVAAVGATTPHGSMTIAVTTPPRDVDPLEATGQVDELVSDQLFEPLVERLSGPYDDARRLPGLALSTERARGGRVWWIRLRSGVRFQDGLPLDASAVVANAKRWRTTPAGRSLLPGLVSADDPKTDTVKLTFDRPVSGMRKRLASRRLGIVSPSALRPRSGVDARVVRAVGAGTGAFELRRGSGSSVVLARYTDWWGTPRGLGPALDQVELRVAPKTSERLRLLRDGDIEAAWSLPATVAAKLRRDPLLTGLTAPDQRSIGLERSVRGITSTEVPPLLSQVWLTKIDQG